ncbi:MAG: hypothetical protein ACKVW3_06095 [Phycisphaerales bacterium]
MGPLVGWGDGGSVPSGNFTAVASGDEHSVAIKADGTLAAWGNNTYGRGSVPSGETGIFKAVASKFRTNVALRANGSILQWGYDWTIGGQQGTQPPTTSNFVAISCGEVFGVAIDTDGKLVAWGNDIYGATQVASLNNALDDAGNPRYRPFRAVAAGATWGIAIDKNGHVRHWGYSGNGQNQVPTEKVVSIAAGDSHAAAILEDGAFRGWGNGTYGQTSLDPDLGSYQRVFCGAWTTFAVTNDGAVYGSGWDTKGELDIPSGNLSIIGGGWHHIVGIQTAQCYANCDNSNHVPTLTAADFTCFSNRFAAGDPYANCDGSTTNPILTVNDFYCFANKYAVGCT